MKKNMIQMLMIILLIFIFTVPAMASIVFKDGYWSTSFGTNDWINDYPSSFNLDGLTNYLNDCAGSGQVPCLGTDQSRGESVLTSANNNTGVEGTAAQVHYFYTGTDGKGSTNDVSGGLFIKFPSETQEYWFRSYIYYPKELGWGGVYNGWKTFYFDHISTAGWYFGFPRSSRSSGFYFQTTTRAIESTGYGDDWLESNNRQGFGRWIPVEIHFKNDTNGKDGIVQVWVDDEIIINVSDHDFGVSGFTRIVVGSNGDAAVGTPNKAIGIRFDDFAIATADYKGFVDDGKGNSRIGLLNGVEPDISINDPDPPSSKVLLHETWENNSTARWQYDFIAGDSKIDTNPVFEGNYVFKHNSINPGNYVHFFGDHPLLQNPSTPVTDITVEEYYRPSEGYNWVTGLKLWIINSFQSWNAGYDLSAGKTKPNSWAPYYMSILVDAKGAPFGQMTRADGLGEPGVLWKNYFPNVGNSVLSVNNWNKIKFRLKLNSPGKSDGIFQLWINDTLQCNYSDVDYRGNYTQYGWNHLMMSMHSVPAPTQNQWVARDNITILSGDGSGSPTPTPAPSRPLAPPLNLKITK